MFGWYLVVFKEKTFVSPVGDEAEHKSSQVEHRDGGSKHHNHPNDSDGNWQSHVILNEWPGVDSLVILLENLFGFLFVAGTATVPAPFAAPKEPCWNWWSGGHSSNKGVGEQSDSNNFVPGTVEVRVEATENKARCTSCFCRYVDSTLFFHSVVDNEENDSCV